MPVPGMYFQEDFMKAAASFPKETRDRIVAALVAYHFYGEEPEETDGPVYAMWIAFRDRIDMSKEKRTNGAKGGKRSKKAKKEEAEESVIESESPVESEDISGETSEDASTSESKTVSKPVSKPVSKSVSKSVSKTVSKPVSKSVSKPVSKSGSKTVSKPQADLLKTETESKTESKNLSPATTTAIATSSQPVGDESGGGGGGEGASQDWNKLLSYALRAYNERFGFDYAHFTIKAREGIKQAWKDGRREEHVDKVLDYAETWEPKYRTPDALFGDKFEHWLNKSSLPAEPEKEESFFKGGIWG